MYTNTTWATEIKKVRKISREKRIVKLKFLQLSLLNSEKFYFGGCSCQKSLNFS